MPHEVWPAPARIVRGPDPNRIRSAIGNSREIEAGALRIYSERSGTIHTLQLCGEFDLASEAGFISEFRRVESEDAEQIVIDLAQLEFMDSTGLRCLLAAAANTRPDAPRVRATQPQGQVKELLERSGLGEHLQLVD